MSFNDVLAGSARSAVVRGDCLETLRTLPSESIDAVVTDPPAGISFMNKEWDDDKGGRDAWVAWLESVMRECLRTLKPGGHALVWAIPRTSHWTATAVENAGFEVRDVITHHFGTGFPKSLDVSKAIDKAAGSSGLRGPLKRGGERLARLEDGKRDGGATWGDESGRDPFTYVAATDAAKRWSGWGTALKPASEHWILARKPPSGTVAANVQRYGVGALNIDGCRVETNGEQRPKIEKLGDLASTGIYGEGLNGSRAVGTTTEGRWPANLVLSHAPACADTCDESCPVAAMDTQAGERVSGSRKAGTRKVGMGHQGAEGDGGPEVVGSTGGASRFFYVAKPAKSERNAGDVENVHPTVKPIELMRYLCRLITPPNGTVLDPFVGSGTTGCAAALEGFRFIGCEQSDEYAKIAEARIAHWSAQAPPAPDPLEAFKRALGLA